MDLLFTDYLALSMFAAFIMLLFTGYPVAWVLCGLAILYTAISIVLSTWTTLMDDSFYVIDWAYASSIIDRNWAVMENWTLVALPMFIFMGMFLDKSGIARDMITNFARLFGRIRGGLAVSVALIGVLLAASTGIIGASVVLLTLLGVPVMLQAGYDKSLAVGTVCAVGTLGILIPPSIMLVLMAERLAISVGDLFMGALLPGLLLGGIYVAFLLIWAWLRPDSAPAVRNDEQLDLRAVLSIVYAILPPSFLIFAVLGSIFFGIATPTEASGVGAAAAILLTALRGRLTLPVLSEVSIETLKTTGFIFAVLFGATAFALVFRGLGGDDLLKNLLNATTQSPNGVVILILLATFILGFFLDWLEITVILLPLFGPILAGMGIDLVWFGILFALCLQTSFITPPVGPAIFYAQGTVPEGVRLLDIYRGIIPFVILQLIALAAVFYFPFLATYLPSIAY